MQKTKTSLKEKTIVGIACFLASSVFMLSVHAKDIVHYTDTETASRVELHEISAKAASELHDHVDKQVLKTFDKSGTGDHFVMGTRTRGNAEMLNEEDPGLWGRLSEQILLFGVYLSLPFTA